MSRLRRTAPETVAEWLEKNEPDWDDAVRRLLQELKKTKDSLPPDIELLREYISEFEDGHDPIRDGWVGHDGLP